MTRIFLKTLMISSFVTLNMSNPFGSNNGLEIDYLKDMEIIIDEYISIKSQKSSQWRIKIERGSTFIIYINTNYESFNYRCGFFPNNLLHLTLSHVTYHVALGYFQYRGHDVIVYSDEFLEIPELKDINGLDVHTEQLNVSNHTLLFYNPSILVYIPKNKEDDKFQYFESENIFWIP
ncbi:MAG: hypothetical protein JJU11_18420 [Candidatus Sumerlaeia bacterium]|nr:hypothetical protein [Candidatus Sumerlaeia bacterium]